MALVNVPKASGQIQLYTYLTHLFIQQMFVKLDTH